MTLEKSKSTWEDGVFDFGVTLGKFCIIILRVMAGGFTAIPWKNPFTYPYIFCITVYVYSIAALAWHIDALEFIIPGQTGMIIGEWLRGFGFKHNLIGLTVFAISALLLCFGLPAAALRRKAQGQLDRAGFKTATGEVPRVKKVTKIDEQRSKILIYSPGIGIENYRNKHGNLQAGFEKAIEQINEHRGPHFIEILLTNKILPQTCLYRDLVAAVKKPYTFVVGESKTGVVTQCLRDLPHMLIAGTTGCGKSLFFKQTLLSVLENSQALQVYILDLKNGVEAKAFEKLPNVAIAKDENTAQTFLRKVKDEMHRRFEYLAQGKATVIEPQRDNMDEIIVAIDEASVIYTKTAGLGSNNIAVATARQLTDEIAKLARAAGIHLILATQKVTKETIDTKVQENVLGKMCFRTNSIQGSVTVLGNKMANDLPDIKGRGIWNAGNQFIEVQAPFVADKEIEERIDAIALDYEEGRKKNFQEMLLGEGERYFANETERAK